MKLSGLNSPPRPQQAASERSRRTKRREEERHTKWSRLDDIHSSGFQIDENGTGNVFVAAGLVEVDVDPLQLKVRRSGVLSAPVDSMLLGNDFPVQRYDSVWFRELPCLRSRAGQLTRIWYRSFEKVGGEREGQ